MGVVKDIEGNSYTTVVIGGQEWMCENLKCNPKAGVASVYNNDNANLSTYGYLYDWAAAKSFNDYDYIAGEKGWHLPSDDEWKQLEIALGMTQAEADKSGVWRGTDQGTQLKEGGSSGVNLQLGGSYGSSYGDLGSRGYYWSSTAYDSSNARNRYVRSGEARVYRGGDSKTNRCSVRLVRSIIPTIEVPDILISKGGQLHSLRGQTIWKNGAGHTFNTGCGVVKNGILYALQETSRIDVGMLPVFTKDGLSMDGGQTICSNYPGQALYTGSYAQHVCISNGMTFMQVWQDDKSIYYTNDKGATWKRYNTGILDWMHCSDDGQVISTPGNADSSLGQFKNNVFPKISRDGGTTWNELPRSLFHQSEYGARACFVASDGQHMGMVPRSQSPTATTDGFTSNYIRNTGLNTIGTSERFFCFCETNPDNTLMFYKTQWASGADNPNTGQVAFYRNNTLVPLNSNFVGNRTLIENAYGLLSEYSADRLHQNLAILNLETKVKTTVPRNAIGHLPANSDLIEIKNLYFSNTHIYYTFTLCDLQTKAKGIIKHNLDGRCRLITGSEEHAYFSLVFNKTFDGFLAVSFDGSGILYRADNNSDFERGETILKTFPEGHFNATRINPENSSWYKGYIPSFYRKFQNVI